MKSTNYKYLSILGFLLFIPFMASAFGTVENKVVFALFSLTLIPIFFYINKNYLKEIKKRRKLFILSVVIPLLIILLLPILRYIVIVDFYDNRNTSCQLNEYSLGEKEKQGLSLPCTSALYMPIDLVPIIVSSVYFSMLIFSLYNTIMILYGFFAIKKKNNIGKRIIIYFMTLEISVLVPCYFIFKGIHALMQ